MTSHKIYIMLQVQLGAIDLPANKEFPRRKFTSEINVVLEHAQRLIRCLIDCKTFDRDAVATRHALDLARSLAAGYWEHSSLQLRQVPQVGPVAVQRLTAANVNTVAKLASHDSAGIERLLGRNPPFGRTLLDSLVKFPCLTIDAVVIGGFLAKPHKLPSVDIRCSLGFTNAVTPSWMGRSSYLTFTAELTDGELVHFWRGTFKQLSSGVELKFKTDVSKPGQKILCFVACEDIVGTSKSQTLSLDIPATAFPQAARSSLPARHVAQNHDQADEDYGDVDDADLIAAMESTSHELESSVAEFVHIDDIQIQSPKVRQTTQSHTESRQMGNGKWTCNHPCSGGFTKMGEECKHNCCHNGVMKSRKRKVWIENVNAHDIE